MPDTALAKVLLRSAMVVLDMRIYRTTSRERTRKVGPQSIALPPNRTPPGLGLCGREQGWFQASVQHRCVSALLSIDSTKCWHNAVKATDGWR